jgi:glutathione S-transferase
MKLYEFGPTRSIRARWTLQELDIPFESVVVKLTENEHKRPEFLQINPAGRLPVLVDGNLIVTESAAIVRYLAEKFPDKQLWPRALPERAQADRWLMFAVTELEQPLWRIARHTFLYPEEQRIPADIKIASREVKEMAAVLEKHMQGREFVAGSHVTVADFVVAYTLDWANEAKLLDDCPVLRAYMERMYARPKAAMRIKAARASIEAG